MKHDITIRSIKTIQEIRFTEQNDGEIGIFLKFTQDALTPPYEDSDRSKQDVGTFSKEEIVNTAIDSVVHKAAEELMPTPTQLAAQEALKKVSSSKLIQAAQETDEQDMVTKAGRDMTMFELAQTITDPVVLDAAEASIQPVKTEPRKRRKKTEETLLLEVPAAEPSPELAAQVIEGIIAPPQFRPIEELKLDWVPGTPFVPEKITEEKIEATGSVEMPADLPTDEQLKSFRSRLFNYTNEILPKGGMVPTDGIGGRAMKIRLYTQKLLNITDLKNLTTAQWEIFLTNMDSMADNPVEMVKAINKAVGA